MLRPFPSGGLGVQLIANQLNLPTMPLLDSFRTCIRHRNGFDYNRRKLKSK